MIWEQVTEKNGPTVLTCVLKTATCVCPRNGSIASWITKRWNLLNQLQYTFCQYLWNYKMSLQPSQWQFSLLKSPVLLAMWLPSPSQIWLKAFVCISAVPIHPLFYPESKNLDQKWSDRISEPSYISKYKLIRTCKYILLNPLPNMI